MSSNFQHQSHEANSPRDSGSRVYLAGHNHKFGYALQREYSETPPKFYKRHPNWVRRLIERYNRIHAGKRD